MDNELKDMLVKLLEGQNRLETTVGGLETTVSGLETTVSGLQTEVKKNSMKLEAIEKKIDIIAEIQTAHKDQNERSFKQALQELSNTNTLVASSLKTVTDDVVEVKKDVKE